MTTASLVLRDVEVEGRRVDVTCRHGRVERLDVPSPHRGADRVIDGGGGALLPGLHDHHIHLLATAAALTSVDLSRPEVGDPPALATALTGAGGPGRWVRATGYHESVAGELDRWSLDRLVADRPVRLQHASGALWVLNSAAVEAAGLDDGPHVEGVERGPDGRPTGRLWRLDAWLRRRIPSPPVDLVPVGARLRGLGVTGVTDTTATDDPASVELLAAAVAAGAIPQHVTVTGGPLLPVDAAPSLPRGPVKIVLGDHLLPSLESLIEQVAAARHLGRAVALHSVTAESLVLAMAALGAAGPATGDRIEHAAVVLPGLHDQLADLGPTVVTQPGMVHARGDRYLAEVDPGELPHLWPCRSLLDAGIRVAAGSDAPYGDLDPWQAMRTASTRLTAAGVPLGPHERIPTARALSLFLGTPADPAGPRRRVAPGAAADLCLLDRPLAAALSEPDAGHVRATVIGGDPGDDVR